MILVVRPNSSNRTGEVVLFGTTVTNNYNVRKNRLVILQCNHKIGCSLNSSWLESEIRYGDIGTLISFQSEVSIKVTDGCGLCTFYSYSCTNDGVALSILNMALDINLRKGTYR